MSQTCECGKRSAGGGCGGQRRRGGGCGCGGGKQNTAAPDAVDRADGRTQLGLRSGN